MLDEELGVPVGAPLFSVATDVPPTMDGAVEALWKRAPALMVPMHHGLHGVEPAGVVELRSLYDATTVYLLARWQSPEHSEGAGAGAGGDPNVWRNLLTVHWRLVDPGLIDGASTGSEGLACTVACHTATADGAGHLITVRNETIPPGLDEDLPSGGGWTQGEWILEWSRPRLSSSPYDQIMDDPAQAYRFFVKRFLGPVSASEAEAHADPVSDVHELWLVP
jgi:hypothetical protein